MHPLFEDGELSKFAAIGFDITERKRNETLKTDFVALVGHELRTPLTVVSGALDAMAEGMGGEMPPIGHELIDMGRRNCARLRKLIEDLLDVNRIETGVVVYQTQGLDLHPLVSRTVQEFASDAEQAGLELCMQLLALDVEVFADPNRVEQVLANLVSNAIKFSPPGRRVQISSQIHTDYLRISVRDQGSGISDEFSPRVFEKFSRAPEVLASGKEGFGLGLSISRALVESMDGRIGFESSLGEGSCFWFELPLFKRTARVP
ncbi:MAG: HAMP domain-containing sensor histidine kinase [Burkholderiaceae bacterium]